MDFNIPIQQITNVNVVEEVSSWFLALPPGHVARLPDRVQLLEEPNGFIAQFWIGRRNAEQCRFRRDRRRSALRLR